MSGQYRASKEKNRSRFYIFLSVVFVLVMAKWGIPFMINAISGPERRRVSISENDYIPPQQPAISALPEATNSAKLTVEGYTEPGAEVRLMVNDIESETSTADESGLFVFQASLRLGDNRISVEAKDASGNKSLSPISLIIYDNEPVTLNLESPQDGSEYFGKSSQTVEVSGKVNKADCEVLVNNSFALVDKERRFSYRLLLSDGENTIKVIATDKAGNKDEEEIKVIFHL